MTEIVFRKRQGREGEMGLFVDTAVFEEEWTSLKIGAEIKAECTVPANLKYLKFFWGLATKVADNCDWLIDKNHAAERILLEARYFKTVFDPLRNKAEVKPKSVSGLSGDTWIRLLRRCTHVVITKFLPGMDENALKAEIEAMIGSDTEPAHAPAPAKPPNATRARKRTQSQFHSGKEASKPGRIQTPKRPLRPVAPPRPTRLNISQPRESGLPSRPTMRERSIFWTARRRSNSAPRASYRSAPTRPSAVNSQPTLRRERPMPKSKIRAPRRPRGEDLAVTIANQDKQIALLISRTETLIAERAVLINRCQRAEADAAGFQLGQTDLKGQINYNNGYIARVKEEDRHRYGDLPGASA